jgi:hypothetical protein
MNLIAVRLSGKVLLVIVTQDIMALPITQFSISQKVRRFPGISFIKLTMMNI